MCVCRQGGFILGSEQERRVAKGELINPVSITFGLRCVNCVEQIWHFEEASAKSKAKY